MHRLTRSEIKMLRELVAYQVEVSNEWKAWQRIATKLAAPQSSVADRPKGTE